MSLSLPLFNCGDYKRSMALFHIRQTENTTVTAKAGVKRNGNLLYTVSPFQDVLETHYQRQLERLAHETARAQLQLGA